jgi:hypothetical protein
MVLLFVHLNLSRVEFVIIVKNRGGKRHYWRTHHDDAKQIDTVILSSVSISMIRNTEEREKMQQ